MRHMKTLTVRTALASEKGVDPAGALFLQVWLAVVSWMVGAAFDTKD